MARSPLDPHHFPYQRRRKTPKSHDERSVGRSDDPERVIDADDAEFVYGPAEAEENDRGLH
jgi:hypothetical protein